MSLAQVEADFTFPKAIHVWLSGYMTGHLGTYMYTEDRDVHRWREGHNSRAPCLGRDDMESFRPAIKNLDLTISNGFDLGPGVKAAVETNPLSDFILFSTRNN